MISDEPYHYIVVKESNHRGVIAAQVAHAAAESFLLSSARDNVNVVILVAEHSDDLERLGDKLRDAQIAHVVIHEPDPPYNGVATAVGIAPTVRREAVRAHLGSFKVLR